MAPKKPKARNTSPKSKAKSKPKPDPKPTPKAKPKAKSTAQPAKSTTIAKKKKKTTQASTSKKGEAVYVPNEGPSFKIYRPGPDSFSFLNTKLVPSAAGKKLSIAATARMALLLNDALNECAPDLGFDGWFFHTVVGAHPRAYISAEHCGPTLCYAPATRSKQDRQLWRDSNLLSKLQESSLWWKPQAFDDKYPVFPIWMPSSFKKASGLFLDPQSAQYISPLLPLAVRDSFDTTMAASRKGFRYTPGLAFVTHQDRLFCASAKKVKGMLMGRGKMRFFAQGTGNITDHAKWLQSHVIDTKTDPVLSLLRRIHEGALASPNDFLTLRRVRTWGHKGKRAMFEHDPADSEVRARRARGQAKGTDDSDRNEGGPASDPDVTTSQDKPKATGK